MGGRAPCSATKTAKPTICPPWAVRLWIRSEREIPWLRDLSPDIPKKKDYEYALKLGTAAGAATAFSEGLGTRDKIYELLHSVQSGE